MNNKDLEFVTNRTIKKDYNITKTSQATIRTTGYLGAVRGYHAKRDGKLWYATRGEVEAYLQRVREWRNLFYNGLRMSEMMCLPVRGKKTWDSFWLREVILKEGVYRRIVAPLPYRFIGVHDCHWHIEDLMMFKRFCQSWGRSTLTESNPVYDGDLQVWRPNYPMPDIPIYSPRYTEGTRLLVNERQNLDDNTIAALRYYRNGGGPRKEQDNTSSE